MNNLSIAALRVAMLSPIARRHRADSGNTAARVLMRLADKLDRSRRCPESGRGSHGIERSEQVIV
jgi:hypothetical protein